MRFRFWRRRDSKPKSVYNWTPASTAMGDHLKIEPTCKGGYVVAKVMDPSEGFRSTAASQWSTADVAESRGSHLARALNNPLLIQRSANGKIQSISFRPREIREQVEHWKWLCRNPRLACMLLRQAHRRGQYLQDSALFL
jgi:hypothetical protein